jgi:deazaflavin-dependent oxidoreductase (nitroreductase family)
MRLARRGIALIRTVLNPIVAMAVRAGLPPRGAHILTTRGRKTGQLRSTPVMLEEWQGTRYLVAPYGKVAWVHNVRGDPSITLTRAGRSQEHRVVETQPAEAAPVLKEYVSKWWPAVAPYFDAGPSDPVEAYIPEASRHPVFRIVEPGR